MPAVTAPSEAGFRVWLGALRSRALAAGLPQAALAPLDSARFDPEVVSKEARQAEFTKAIWDYLDIAASQARVDLGQDALRRHKVLFDALEARYGVPREILAALWGVETNYGSFRGDFPVIGTLASLAYASRRPAFFEHELLEALRILDEGHVRAEAMRGSWAGAMGHTQFMPSSFWRYAVDFTGDGKRDLWSDNPADALASAAAYLAANGWERGGLWGLELRLPEGFDYRLAGDGTVKPLAEWRALGLRQANGAPLPEAGPGSVILPAGAEGVAFLVFANFRALESYNPADAYVIGLGHLADRLAGGAPLHGTWPRADGVLSPEERVDLQRRLALAGFDPGGADGKIGPKTFAAVQAFQMAEGLRPDGYASPALLRRLKALTGP